MADYEHHIFISYRRSDDEWVRWTRQNFVRALSSLMRVSLDKLSVFIDENIETGASWPAEIARHLARSRLMVAILSRAYFHSDWCRLELALMHHREQLARSGGGLNGHGLIIPVVIDDGECFPAEVQEMQCQKLHDFANPFIRIDSTRQEELAEVLRRNVCPVIERALKHIPDYDPKWEEIAHGQFKNTFKINVQAQKTVPSLVLQGVRWAE